MKLQFGTSSYERARGDMPQLPVINQFAEEAPTEETGLVLQSRPGLADREADMGAGPVLALFKGDGVLSGALFGVSAGHLWQGTTDLGAITGSGPFSMAGYENLVFVAGGAGLWGWDGATLGAITFPDSASVAKVVVGASRALLIRADTGYFYWSDVLSDTIDALSFAEAESSPDRLLDLLFIDDTAILFGAETVEFWPNTGDADSPFQPLEGRVFSVGIKATGCAAQFGESFAWVTNNNQVCLQEPGNIVSNAGLEAKIAESAEVGLFTFFLGGTEFLGLRLDTETHVLSARSRLWSQFASYDEDNWIVRCHDGGVFGSAVDGKTLEWGDGHSDLDSVLERRFRAGAPLNSGGFPINNLIIRTNPGNTPYVTDAYATPVVEMRLSRDAGKTWGNWKQRSLGSQGNYRTKVQWEGLGMFGQPGVLAEFRVTDPVPFRCSDVLINETFGGP